MEKRAAENEDLTTFEVAHDMVAMQYQFGQGVPKNLKMAVKWFSKGFEIWANIPKSQRDTNWIPALNHLGSGYESGEFGRINLSKAYMWYHLGEMYSERNQFAKKLTSIQIALAKKLAAECVAKKYKGC